MTDPTPRAATGSELAKATDQALSDPLVKNLVYGEVIHADNRFFGQFVSPENMDSMKRNGVTEIAIELPKDMQLLADMYMRGDRTAEQFKSSMKNMFQFFDMDEATADQRRSLIVDMLQRAKERGIAVKFVDHLDGTQEMAEIKKPENEKKLTDCAQRKVGAMTEAELEKMSRDMMKLVTKLTVECLAEEPELKKLSDKVDQGRLQGDKTLGKEAADRNPNGRTVFFYGNAHGAGIAGGHPGKSVGIAGAFDQNSDGIRKMTPFFFYHFNIESGETQTPSVWQRIFGAERSAPAQTVAMAP